MNVAVENYGSLQFAVVNWTLCGLSVVITAARIAIRYHLLRTLRLEDYFAILATVFMILMAICNELSREGIYLVSSMVAQLASGKTMATLTPPYSVISAANVYQLKVQVAFMMFFWSSIWSVKASLLSFYRGLFVNVKSYMLWYWVVVGLSIATYLGCVLSNIMCCMPMSRRWDPKRTRPCPISSGRDAIYAASAFDIFTDICIMILPVKLILGIRIPLRQKIALTGIFCLGIVVILFATLRMQKMADSINKFKASGNIILAMWSVIEAFVAIIVGNLPVLRSVITQKGETYGKGSGAIPSRQTNDRSKVGPDSHIRLYDMSGDHTAEVGAKYGSDEALNKMAQPGITKTQQVSVTVSENVGRRKESSPVRSDQESLDSVADYGRHTGRAM